MNERSLHNELARNFLPIVPVNKERKIGLNKLKLSLVAAMLAGIASVQNKVRIEFIDPLSGSFVMTGTLGLAICRYSVKELVSQPGGLLVDKAEFEMVPFDNKISAKESLIQLCRNRPSYSDYLQGVSSGVADAQADAMAKLNPRNPDDPALTNYNCSFWDFSFDVNVDTKMGA